MLRDGVNGDVYMAAGSASSGAIRLAGSRTALPRMAWTMISGSARLQNDPSIQIAFTTTGIGTGTTATATSGIRGSTRWTSCGGGLALRLHQK
jgi:hypothetical protein